MIEKVMAQAPYFLLVFTRISGFMAFVPFFNNRNYIMIVKVAFALLFSFLLFPTIPVSNWNVPTDLLGFMWIVIAEILVGVLIGLVFMILLFVLELTGRMVGFQMAFSMANVVDSTFGTNTNVLSVMMLLMGTMIFVSIGGDHYLLFSLSKSFSLLAPGTFTATKPLLKSLSDLIMHAFNMGFRLAAPAIILLLCIDLTLGLVGKTAQKMQIFFVGLPLKIAIGLFSFTLILGFIVSVWAKDITKFPEILMGFFKSMRVV